MDSFARFFMEIVRLPTIPEHVVRRVLFYERRSEVSREGEADGEGGGRNVRERMIKVGRAREEQ